jgi:hypothetical protein
MTPQESELLDQLFDRLANLENTPRDADAERKIADGLRRAPHAIYALVQTTLLQDEALKRANARIEELQAQAPGTEEAAQPTSFLDSMRAAFGGGQPHGSVPSVRSSGYQAGPPPYPPQTPPSGYGYAASPGFGTGGSFLGTAASAAAGVVGGALLLDGIRSMFGHHSGAPSAFGGLPPSPAAAPWGGSAADSDLAREAGIDDIGKNTGAPQSPPADAPDDMFGTPDDQSGFDDADFSSDDDGGGGGGDSYDV